MQTYTSSKTSVNRTHLPKVYGTADLRAPFVLDYGCGKYTDHIADALHAQGRELFPFDPYNQPEDVNRRTIDRVRVCVRSGVPVDVICSNVLNVIDDDGTIRFIVDQIGEIVRRTGGRAFFTVYEGDRSCVGRQTGADQYQRNEPIRSYLRFFFPMTATVTRGMIVVEG